MRNISFALTTAQFLDGSKTVTRRLGWKNLKPATRLMAVKKAMGLKPGEKVERLGEFEVLDVRMEPLFAITERDVALEGFPGKTADWFVDHFANAMGCARDAEVTRIQFRRVGAVETVLGALHLWTNDCDFVIAFSADDALAILREHGDDDTELDRIELWPDERPFTFIHNLYDDQSERETKPAGEFVRERGRGFFATTEY